MERDRFSAQVTRVQYYPCILQLTLENDPESCFQYHDLEAFLFLFAGDTDLQLMEGLSSRRRADVEHLS